MTRARGRLPGVAAAARAAAVLLFVAAALGWLAPLHWFAELFAHFLPHYTAAAFILAAVFALLRRPGPALACTALAVVECAALVTAQPAPGAGADSPDAITVVQFNAGTGRADPGETAAWLRADPADVVVLVEVTGSAWERAMDALADVYPHQVRDLSGPPFGIALLTRLEPEAMRVHRDLGTSVPYATLRTHSRVLGVPVSVWGVHPPPPLGGAWAGMRDVQLLAIAREAGTSRDRVGIVAGDFNVTPWAPTYRAMLAAGLSDARSLYPLQNTWPALPGSRAWGLPIDHTLVSSGARIEARTVGPSLGSDHHAVTSRIRFARPGPPPQPR